MITSKLKRVIAKHSYMLAIIYNFFCHNKTKVMGKGNIIEYKSTFMNKCRIEIRGDNNTLILNDLHLFHGGG